jgi:hypothetical protein
VASPCQLEDLLDGSGVHIGNDLGNERPRVVGHVALADPWMIQGYDYEAAFREMGGHAVTLQSEIERRSD